MAKVVEQMTTRVRISAEQHGGYSGGWVGVLKLLNGHRVESTDVRPEKYQAIEAAESLAERRGYGWR